MMWWSRHCLSLWPSLAEPKVKTIGDTVGDVHWEALVDTSADTLAKVKTDPHHDTLGHVNAEALIITLAIGLEQAKPKHLAAHWRM